MKKNIVRTGLFIAGFLLLLIPLSRVLGNYDTTHGSAMFRQFYSLPKDTVDVTFVGASAIQEDIIPPVLYDEAGITAFDISHGNMATFVYEHMIKECEQRQDPVVYFVDLRAFGRGLCSNDLLRVDVDNMKWSSNKLSLINYAYPLLEKYHPGTADDYLTYFFPLSKYHSRWTQLKKEDFTDKVDLFFGCLLAARTYVRDKADIEARFDAEPVPLEEEGMRYLNDFLDFCDGFDKPVVFIETPSCVEKEVFSLYNEAERIVTERGYPVWNLNREVDEIGIDYETDWADTLHLNTTGAVKLSKYIARVIAEEYSLPDRRGESSRYRAWEKMSAFFDERLLAMQLSAIQNFNQYLDYLAGIDTERYSILMAVKDIQGFCLTQEMIDKLQVLGFSQNVDVLLDHQYHSFVGVLGEGQVLWEQIGYGDDSSHYWGEICGNEIGVDSYVLQSGNKAYISINGSDFSVNKRGFNIVVYDNKEREVVDSVSFDTHYSEEIPCSR